MSVERRFKVAQFVSEGPLRLDAAAVRHAQVLRLKVGDEISLFDGAGWEAKAQISRLDADGLECVLREPPKEVERGPRVTLVQGMPKGQKLDTICRMTTELGVHRIHLVETVRSVVRLNPVRAEKRRARLLRIAEEASRQSLRADVPLITGTTSWTKALELAPLDALRIVFVPGGATRLTEVVGMQTQAWVAIGPEGGLSLEEVQLAAAQGWHTVGLETPVLRVETAAPVAVALVTHALCGVARRHRAI